MTAYDDLVRGFNALSGILNPPDICAGCGRMLRQYESPTLRCVRDEMEGGGGVPSGVFVLCYGCCVVGFNAMAIAAGEEIMPVSLARHTSETRKRKELPPLR